MNKLIFCLLLLCSCEANTPSQVDSLKGVNKLEIIDKRAVKFFDKTVITDTSLIIDFLAQVHKMTGIKDTASDSGRQPYVKNNFGFFDVFVYNKDKQVDNLQIIYTVYNGVIIVRNLNDLYKNDDLEILVLAMLQEKNGLY